ncbi:SOS response-associated peptidase family protein, partial [Klebsiella pneumoniae]|uniref:SOS response-associated peptidase family protein n=1 Tax=Klebsiella pneumoniae TaxID=573 RepID=UPI00396A01AA
GFSGAAVAIELLRLAPNDVDIHDRRPLVLAPEAAREWMRQDVTGAEAAEIASIGAVPADDFTWHPVTRAVGNVKNQGPELLAPLSP